jgi:hypothetical protein
MADNITLDPGTGGAVIRTDDDGTAQWQYVKVVFGADNTQTIVTSSAGLPVELLLSTAEIGNVKNSGTFATQATLQAGTAEVGKLAAGVAEIGNVKNSGTFVVQSTLQAGTAEIGKLAAGTASIGILGANSGVDIGDITINNSTGASAVNIQDGGNSITVDNAGLTELAAAINASSQMDVNIAASNATVTVDGSGVTQPISGNVTNAGTFATQATLQAGTAEIGKLAAGAASIGTLGANSGVDIGDVDVASQPARDRLTDNIGVALQTDAILSDTTALTPKFAVIAASGSGDNTLVAAVSAKKIRVLQYVFVAASAVTVRFESGAAGTALSGQMEVAANSGVGGAFNPIGHFETASNTLLNLELSSAISVAGHLVYVEV